MNFYWKGEQKMKDLDSIRQNIDKIDKEIIKLFQERMKCVKDVIEYKITQNIPILNANREQEVIAQNIKYIEDESIQKYGEAFLKSMMQISRGYQSEILNGLEKKECNIEKEDEYLDGEIAYQGIQGSFSEEAALTYFKTDKYKLVNCQNFKEVFEKVRIGEVRYGIIPIENSSTGSISEVYDLLREYLVFINGEIILNINQNLVGVKGARVEDLKEVYSHVQGFQQSTKFLKEHEDWLLIPYHNTAMSAEFVKSRQDITKGAIASKRAAEVYKLDILVENINDNKTNCTKFIIISKQMLDRGEFNKTSIMLNIEHTAGKLSNILNYFSEGNLNLLKIESRPILNKPWTYSFYIDFEGNIKDKVVSEILDKIENECSFLKVLGCYKNN